MCMWPQPFLWRTFTGRCWPRVLKFDSGEVSGVREYDKFKLLDKLLFQRKLCYHASQETIWLQKDSPFVVKLGMRGPQPFSDCPGHDFRIISVALIFQLRK